MQFGSESGPHWQGEVYLQSRLPVGLPILVRSKDRSYSNIDVFRNVKIGLRRENSRIKRNAKIQKHRRYFEKQTSKIKIHRDGRTSLQET